MRRSITFVSALFSLINQNRGFNLVPSFLVAATCSQFKCCLALFFFKRTCHTVFNPTKNVSSFTVIVTVIYNIHVFLFHFDKTAYNKHINGGCQSGQTAHSLIRRLRKTISLICNKKFGIFEDATLAVRVLARRHRDRIVDFWIQAWNFQHRCRYP